MATDDAFLVSGRNEDLKRALDVKANQVNGLADDEFFLQQLATLHSDRLGVFFYDYSTIASAPTTFIGLPPQCLDQMSAMSDMKMLGELRAEGDFFAVNTRARIPTGENLPPAAANKRSPLLESVPGTTVAYLEMRQLGQVASSAITQLLTCMDTAEAPMNLQQIEQALGVSVPDYFDFIDDAGVALTHADARWGGGLIATVDDEAVAATRIERLLSFVRLALLAPGGGQGGSTIVEEQHGDVTITVIRLPEPPGAPPAPVSSLSLAVANGKLYIGADDFVTGALDRAPADSLSASTRLQAALSAAGQENAGLFYFDLAALRVAAEAMIPAEDRAIYDTEQKPFVEPLDQLIVVNRTDGSINATHAFLYVE